MRKQAAVYLIIWIFLVPTLTMIAAHQLYLYEADVYGQSYIGRTPCNELIYIYSGQYWALSCQSPFPLITNSVFPSSVINTASTALTTGGLIFIANGTYPLTTQLHFTANNGILEGAANSTILKYVSALATDGLLVSGNGWILRDFQLNLNGEQGTGNNYNGVYFTGNTEQATDLTVLNGDECGIMFSGNNNFASQNTVNGMANQGLCTEGNDGAGPNSNTRTSFVQNTILSTGASNGANCFTFAYTTNVTLTGNVGNGCFEGIYGNTHVAYMTATGNTFSHDYDSGVDFNANAGHNIQVVGNVFSGGSVGDEIYFGAGNYLLTISGNTISQTNGFGINIHGAYHVIAEGNTISGAGNSGIGASTGAYDLLVSHNIIIITVVNQFGISVVSNSGVHDFTFDYNLINGTLISAAGIFIGSAITNFTLSYNTVVNVNPGTQGFLLQSANSNFYVVYNTVKEVDTCNGCFTGVYTNNPHNFHVDYNHFYGSGVSGRNPWYSAVEVDGNSGSDGSISNNGVLGDIYNPISIHGSGSHIIIASNVIRSFEQDISLKASANYLIIINNIFDGNTYGPIEFSSKGNNTVVENNQGYNPIGAVANFIFKGGSGADDGNYISPIGTTSTLTASTTYTVTTSPVLIIFATTGTGVSVAVNGGAGYVVTLGESVYLNPGQTINFGAFSVAPTLQVSFS